jgi:hypothetical protein
MANYDKPLSEQLQKDKFKSLKINCPPGYKIDMEKSNLNTGEIFFKKITDLAYENICKELFTEDTITYYIDSYAGINSFQPATNSERTHANNSVTKEQLESILALNKLCNVAKYLNNGGKPVFTGDTANYTITYYQKLKIEAFASTNSSSVFFKSKELAEKAIEILGKEEIRKALTLNH